MASVTAYIMNSKNQIIEVPGAERAKLIGDVVYLHETGDENHPLAFVKLHPDTIVTFGNQPPRAVGAR